jgi:hypothetical protein
MGDVTHTQADEIAAPQFAVDRQIEHGQVADRMCILKVDAVNSKRGNKKVIPI